jgi:chromosomal replication initiator protein
VNPAQHWNNNHKISQTMNELQQIWERALLDIELSVSQATYSMWFKEVNVLRQEDGTVFLAVPNNFVQEWLYKKFHNTILRSFRQANGTIRALEYIITKEKEDKKSGDPKKSSAQPTIAMPLHDYYVNKEDNLNPRYTFDSFVIGPFNELAHAAARAVVKMPGKSYNPLFIYGPTGVGKTHLMQAVGNHIKKEFPGKKVFYLTSERFAMEYIVSVQSNKANQFKEKYRKYDVIIMDDIQFFSNTEKSQEELFHLFNTFRDTDRQLVFSSDRHVNFIPGIEDRLRNRFASGMIVDIPEPDRESRIAILQAKCRTSGLSLTDEILGFLTDSINPNIRELEGAINTIVCQTQLKERTLSAMEIKNLLKNSAKPKKNIAVKDVVKTIADFYNISEEIIYNKTRKKEVVKPRQIIMYILREDLNISFPSIGEKLGGRDHTTVIHSCEKIKEELKTNPVLLQELSQIRAMI